MSIPARPHPQHQGPAGHCVIHGIDVSWTSCTCYSVSMGIDRSTIGAKTPSGCLLRSETGDLFGGTTLRQCTSVAQARYGVTFSVHTGSNLLSPRRAGSDLMAGRGIVVQGNAGALLNTKYRSTNGSVNHAVWVNEGRGFDGSDIPDEVLVYDPAADGRRAGIADSPDWWPWALLLKFAAWLEPAGDGTKRLGYGGWYAAVGPSTEPHAHLKFGGKRTKPFPDRTRATPPKGRRVNVHALPSASPDTVIDHLDADDLFVAYQKTTTGESFRGSRIWYGGHDGTTWVHECRLSHEGGST